MLRIPNNGALFYLEHSKPKALATGFFTLLSEFRIGEEPVFSRSKTTAKFKKGMREDVEALDDAAMTAYRQNISSVANDIMDFMGRIFPNWNTRSWKREGI